MSVINGKNSDISEENIFHNINRFKIADTKENVIINKIDKIKLKNDLINLNIEDIDNVLKKYLNAYKKDFKIMKNFKSVNILECVDFIDREKEIIIIKENADTSLYDYIKSKNKGLELEEIKFIFNQINNIVKIIRKNNIIHSCLSPSNLFLKYDTKKDNYIIKLSDLGSLIKLELQLKIQLNIKDKINYIAPEFFKFNDNLDISSFDKADLWSLGVILFFIRYNKLPFESNNINILNNNNDEDSNLLDILNRLLIEDPEKRISWENYTLIINFLKIKNYQKK